MIFMEILQLYYYAVSELPSSRSALHQCIYSAHIVVLIYLIVNQIHNTVSFLGQNIVVANILEVKEFELLMVNVFTLPGTIYMGSDVSISI